MSDPLDDIIANLSTKIAAKKGNARAPELDEIEALEAKEAADAKAAGQAAKAAAEASAANPSPWMQRQMANNPPLPGPSLAHELGQSAKEVGIGGAKALQAIPVAAGDAFSGGLIGRGEEAAGIVPPGWNQKVMDEGGAGTQIGQMAGVGASALAGPLRPIAAGAGGLARALRGAGAVGQLGERVIGGSLATGGFSATDRALRGGSPSQVFDAGMTGAAIGGGIPAVAGVASKIGGNAVLIGDGGNGGTGGAGQTAGKNGSGGAGGLLLGANG